MFRKSVRFFLLFTLLALVVIHKPPHLSARPLASLTHTTAISQSSTARAPNNPEVTQLSVDSDASALAGKAAFALELYPDEKIRYIPNADNPGEWIFVGSIENRAYYAGDFVGRDYSQIYVIDYGLNELHTVNTSTGVTTTIGSCNPLPEHVWTGATGTAGGILYASSTNDVISYFGLVLDEMS